MGASIRILLFSFFLSLFFTLAAQDQGAYTVENLPDPKSFGNGYVSNPDNILDAQDVAVLN